MTDRKERAGAVQGNRGKGRKKGVPNKLTREVKEMVLTALDNAGGDKYLLRQAEENPTAFMTLLGKIIPTQITGADGKSALNFVVYVPDKLSANE